MLLDNVERTGYRKMLVLPFDFFQSCDFNFMEYYIHGKREIIKYSCTEEPQTHYYYNKLFTTRGKQQQNFTLYL